MSVLRAISLLACASAVGAGAWFGRTVPFVEQWPMFEALRTTAAIIFAVIGAWMAIIYPERLKLTFRRAEAPDASQGATGWGQLFTPVVNSTGILAVILVVGVVAPLFRANPVKVPLEVVQGATYALLVALTLWQLWTVLLTLVPADRVKSYLDDQDAKQAAIRGLKSGSSVHRPSP